MTYLTNLIDAIQKNPGNFVGEYSAVLCGFVFVSAAWTIYRAIRTA